MENFERVSLGFAEFVSQLLHETFEATLAAQNYQLEKFNELFASLNLSDERFKEAFLSDELLLEKEMELFGTELSLLMWLEELEIKAIDVAIGTLEGIVYQNRLLDEGFRQLKQFVVETAVAERKQLLQALLNKGATRISVSSGEIKAKIELSSIREMNRANQIDAVERTPEGVASAGASSVELDGKSKEKMHPTCELTVQKEVKEMKIKEMEDVATKEKVIFIDRSAFVEEKPSRVAMPNVRLMARPISSTQTSAFGAEITIHFTTHD